MREYLESIVQQFEYYKVLGDKTIAQVSDSDLSWKYNPESNSIAMIIKHMNGNMLSRWTDFLTTDGEKAWRNRDAEFENDVYNRSSLIKMWDEGWSCLFTTLGTLNEDNFKTIIYIRNQAHTITEAINRQIAHYSYHVGQIVFIGKMVKDNLWQSLSIPRGSSLEFNKEKFSQPVSKEHFTNEFAKTVRDKDDLFL